MTKVRLKPGNTVTLEQLRKIIKDGGFNPGAADLDVLGTVVERQGTPTLLVTGTASAFRLSLDPKYQDALRGALEAMKEPQSALLVVGRVEAGDHLIVRQVREPR